MFTRYAMLCIAAVVTMFTGHVLAQGTGPCLLTIPPDEVCSVLPDDFEPCCPPGYTLYCDPCTGEPLDCLPPGCELPDCAYDCPVVICVLPHCLEGSVPPSPSCRNCDEICLPSCWVETNLARECLHGGSRVYTFDFCMIDCTALFDLHWQVCSAGTDVAYTVLSPTSSDRTFCVEASGPGQLTVIALANDGSCETYSVEERVQIQAVCAGDVDGNGTVDINDLVSLLGAWGPCPLAGPCDGACCPQDFNGDGSVGNGDLTIVLAAWGPCP